MGYNILSKIIEFTDSEEPLEKRLENVGALLLNFFAFDQCAVYLLDREERKLNLAVAIGNKLGCQQEYNKDEGLPGLAMKHGKPIFATHSQPNKELWRGVFDQGALGFATVICCPVKDDIFYGILYLKSREKKSISPKKKKLLDVIALQLSTAIKNYECIINLTHTNTKMKDMQARLIHAEKLLALGEMAATLTHEIRNPLMSIGGFAKRLHQQLNPDSSQFMYANRIIKGVERLEKLMDGIVHFSKKDGCEFSTEDINNIIEDAALFFEDDFKRHNITVVRDVALNLPKIEADRQQLRLVFNNLMANAIQAMANGGTLTIQTRHKDNWIVTEVCDTGGGIDPKIMGNIFNPFYTTKETGTGLGLAITHTIITNHKGIIEVNNKMGVGVTFVIKLPVATICEQLAVNSEQLKK
ncbi:MAG: GAF domain-containing protein [Deltaproteobacteria bacterium]|nr:GAF domain-containing protein [Deltaproteobacteria bacterium]